MGLVIVLLASNFFLSVSGAAAVAGVNPNARAVARAIEAHYRSISSMKAVFLESYREGQSSGQMESGTVYFRRPGQMRWEYEAPTQKLFLVDGKYVWFYVPADHTASRASVKKSEDWRTPFALLTGKTSFDRLCGVMELLSSQDNSAGKAETGTAQPGDVLLRCLPRAQEKRRESLSDGDQAPGSASFNEILIEADAGQRLVRVVVRQPGNIETEIRFANWQEDVPLPVAMFRFNPPMGVAIVDEATLLGNSR